VTHPGAKMEKISYDKIWFSVLKLIEELNFNKNQKSIEAALVYSKSFTPH
jgi:hypothetical protein